MVEEEVLHLPLHRVPLLAVIASRFEDAGGGSVISLSETLRCFGMLMSWRWYMVQMTDRVCDRWCRWQSVRQRVQTIACAERSNAERTGWQYSLSRVTGTGKRIQKTRVRSGKVLQRLPRAKH